MWLARVLLHAWRFSFLRASRRLRCNAEWRVRADRVFPIENLSPREAVMVEPTSCALHGMEVLQMNPGSNVLPFGAGPTGQVLAQLLPDNLDQACMMS
jgi:hypothetical protein